MLENLTLHLHCTKLYFSTYIHMSLFLCVRLCLWFLSLLLLGSPYNNISQIVFYKCDVYQIYTLYTTAGMVDSRACI